MLKSMTAYGRGSLSSTIGHFVVEIQSVNRKHLEIQVILPQDFSRFDIDVKKWVTPFITRGHVTIRAKVAIDGSPPFMVRPNISLASQFKEAWEKIAKELHFDEKIQLAHLKGIEGLFSIEESHQEEDNYRNLLKQTLEIALEGFLHMKLQEGVTLQLDLLSRIENMSQAIHMIEQKALDATVRYREKLMARLEEILPGRIENEERILREIALLAEKMDITEEITRFHSHLEHLKKLIESTDCAVGKTIEFILQELNREANTIGSKSSELAITRSVIEIKSEIEKMREQIQNVE